MQVDRRLIEQVVDEFYQASGSARMAALIMKLEDVLNTRDLLLTVTPAQVAHAAAVEPCNKSCAPGYCYCEPIIQSKIKEDKAEPVALPCCGYTDASAIKWNPFNGVVQCHNCGQTYTHPPRCEWHGLTDAERDYFKACGFVGVSRVEEVLRAKNSTLACIPAVPPGLEDIEGKKGL
jgi:hypothetical protein